MQSRSFNVARNAIVSLICQFITIILGFVCRKALILSLGLAYVGANSLFTSIISILSFVELGIGNAIIFSLYKPVAQNNTNAITSYINYYKKVYNLIALSILILGICVIPFLDILVSVDEGIRESISVMYVLSLIATSSTYLFAAPKTLLIADQKQYIEKIIYQISHILQVFFQIVVLFVFKSYYMFLVMQIIFALANNIFSTLVVKKKYPFVVNHSSPITENSKKSLFADIRAMFCYKIGTSLLNYIDTIFISAFCGLIFLGKIANYVLILATLSGIITQLTSALSASIGNKNALESKEKCGETFFLSLFVIIWVTGFFLVAFVFLVNPFIELVFGHDCVIKDPLIITTLALCYFVSDTHSLSATYRYSMGVFRQGKFAPLIASAINVVLSIILFRVIGVPGLYIATIIARVISLGIVDSYLILGGKQGTIKYFISASHYLIVIAILGLIGVVITNFIPITNIVRWIICGLSLAFIYNTLWLALFYRSKECKYIINYSKVLVGKFKNHTDPKM